MMCSVSLCWLGHEPEAQDSLNNPLCQKVLLAVHCRCCGRREAVGFKTVSCVVMLLDFAMPFRIKTDLVPRC